MSPEVEQASFQIIASVGAARSNYVEAIHRAKEGDFDGAEELIAEGQQLFTAGHDAHFSPSRRRLPVSRPIRLIFMHAEDQLMSAEAFGILAEEFISVYQTIAENRTHEHRRHTGLSVPCHVRRHGARLPAGEAWHA